MEAAVANPNIFEMTPTSRKPPARTHIPVEEVDAIVAAVLARQEQKTWLAKYGHIVLFLIAQICGMVFMAGKTSTRLDGIEAAQKTMSSQMISADTVNARFSGMENELRNNREATDGLSKRIERLETSAMENRRLR